MNPGTKMNNFHILQGTRMGRKVLTEAEFFEQLEKDRLEADEVEVIKKKHSGYKRKTSKKRGARYVLPTPEEVLVGPSSSQTNPSSSPHPYFIAPGRFLVGDIQKLGNVYVFHDLELPMGSWNRLDLSVDLVGGPTREFDDWAMYTQVSLVKGVMPIDIRYGLMTVCYLNRRKKSLKTIIEHINEHVWFTDAISIPYNSTRVIYRRNDGALITPGVGWDQSHPFNVTYEANIAGKSSQIGKMYATSDPSIYSALEGLLGENDAQRCALTLRWSMGINDPWLIRLDKNDFDARTAVFGIRGKCPELITDRPKMYAECARAIVADKQYFSKR